MAKIKVHDLKPTGSELFNDSESFMNELSSDELEQAMGGGLIYTSIVTFTTVQNSHLCFTTTVFTQTVTVTITPRTL